MNEIKLEKLLQNKEYFIENARKNKLFIYPTDTIYWIWAIANKENSKKIYWIKNREKNKALSIIAPNKERIKNNFIVNDNFDKRFDYYFYKFHWITIILEKKNKSILKGIWKENKVWVRIIKSKFQELVNELWEAFITTSANISWIEYKQDFKHFKTYFWNDIDFFIDWWNLSLQASKIIDFTDWEKIIR